LSMYSVRSILILANEGNRLVAKYYTDEFPTLKEQTAFEKSLFTKTSKANGEIIMLDSLLSLYKNSGDTFMYVNGPPEENEVMLANVLGTLSDTLSSLLRGGQVDKRSVLENFDVVLLTLDEMIDGGIILETDPQVLIQRVSMRDAIAEVPLAEQTVSQTLSTVTERLKNQFLKT